MLSDDSPKDEPAPLNILEYTFSEKMLFVDTSQLKKFHKVYPKILKKDIKPFALLAIKDMEGQTPRVGGIGDMMQYVGVRSLVHTLFREATLTHKHKPPANEIYDYLLSLNLSPDCCRELVTLLLTPNLFDNVPRNVRMNPTITSTRWMIDLSYCQTNFNDIKQEDYVDKLDILRKHMNVILIMDYSDGTQHVIGLPWRDLGRLRLEIAEALQEAEESNEALRMQEMVDRETLLMMRAEGHV